MKLVYSNDYEVDIGSHVYKTNKYRLIKEKLLSEGDFKQNDILVPIPAADDEILTVHTQDFLKDMHELRYSGHTVDSELPLTKEIVDAFILAAGGTILACRAALAITPGICCHIGGGFHHAFPDRAEGFCYINDVAIAIRVMQKEGRIARAAVIDCDVHQGNGTAVCFANDPTVFTYSIHQENNYPLKKETSTLDTPLNDYTTDDEYIASLEMDVIKILDGFNPELVVFLAGADPYQDDTLGGLKMTFNGLEERDRFVFNACAERTIPIVSVTSGGYAQYLKDTVKIHSNTCKAALQVFQTHQRKKILED